jgi:hypothetical protein
MALTLSRSSLRMTYHYLHPSTSPHELKHASQYQICIAVNGRLISLGVLALIGKECALANRMQWLSEIAAGLESDTTTVIIQIRAADSVREG